MSTRRAVQLAEPHVHRAAILAVLCSVVHVGAGLATAGGFALQPFVQAVPYLFVGVVVRTTVTRGMPYRQFQFALVLLGALFVGMAVVALQQYVVSDAVASRTFLILPVLDAVGLGLTVRGWWAARTA